MFKKLFFISVLSLVIVSCGETEVEKEKKLAQEKATKDSIEAIRIADSIKIADDEAKKSAESLGMWEIAYYVDEFGDPSNNGFIRNTNLISGVFSNSATDGSSLKVKFLIDSEDDVDIMLYEYDDNMVKGRDDSYSILVRYKGGNELSLVAKNYSDRLSIAKKDAKKLINAFMQHGGEFKFIIREVSSYGISSKYNFVIENVGGITKAFEKLKNG